VFEFPEFVPKVELLVAALGGADLPVRTHALLMQHYERTGAFAKAEDALFAMLDAEPDNAALVEFGLAFYQRVLAQSDTALSAATLCVSAPNTASRPITPASTMNPPNIL